MKELKEIVWVAVRVLACLTLFVFGMGAMVKFFGFISTANTIMNIVGVTGVACVFTTCVVLIVHFIKQIIKKSQIKDEN